MNQELELIASRLSQAHTPEEVFGEIHAGRDDMLSTLKRHYRAIVKVAHPDVYRTEHDRLVAQKAFYLLTDWFHQAKDKILAGQYGRKDTSPKMILQTRTREYAVEAGYVQEELFNSYPCSFSEHGRLQRAVLKIVRDPWNNDLVENERRALAALARGRDAKKFSPYIPQLLDAFLYEDAGIHRQAVVFRRYENWFSLEDVHNAYPGGIDPRDMAWMWRRLLVVLGFAHTNNVLHGAVLPRNVLILPEEHGLMLGSWSYALVDPASTGEVVSAIVSDYADWYPQEVLNKEPPLFGTDIQMSAKCMLWLLGGDPRTKTIPNSVPAPIKAFLKGCLLPGKRAPQDAWSLLEEFDELLGKLWGKRTFHPFYMK